MYKITSTCFVLSLFLFSDFALAKKSVELCEKEQKTVQGFSRCLDSIKDTVDNELQMWLNNQIFVLEELSDKTGRSSPLQMFNRSQTNFIRYRENNCRWQYLTISPDRGAAEAYKKCYILMTQDRINELTLLSKEPTNKGRKLSN